MQPCFLQTEKHRVGAIERPKSARRQTISRSAIGFIACRKSKLQLFFAALFEDAQNVSRITQIETRQRLDEGQNAMHACVLGCDRCIIDEAKWRAVCAISLAEPIILQIEAAIIIKSRPPQHRAMIHHAVIDIVDDFIVAKTAGLLRDTQIPGVDEADEFRRFVVEPRI